MKGYNLLTKKITVMKKTMKYFMFLLVSTMVVFTSCKDEDEPNGGGACYLRRPDR